MPAPWRHGSDTDTMQDMRQISIRRRKVVTRVMTRRPWIPKSSTSEDKSMEKARALASIVSRVMNREGVTSGDPVVIADRIRRMAKPVHALMTTDIAGVVMIVVVIVIVTLVQVMNLAPLNAPEAVVIVTILLIAAVLIVIVIVPLAIAIIVATVTALTAAGTALEATMADIMGAMVVSPALQPAVAVDCRLHEVTKSMQTWLPHCHHSINNASFPTISSII
jgi:hypothetical protein